MGGSHASLPSFYDWSRTHANPRSATALNGLNDQESPPTSATVTARDHSFHEQQVASSFMQPAIMASASTWRAARAAAPRSDPRRRRCGFHERARTSPPSSGAKDAGALGRPAQLAGAATSGLRRRRARRLHADADPPLKQYLASLSRRSTGRAAPCPSLKRPSRTLRHRRRPQGGVGLHHAALPPLVSCRGVVFDVVLLLNLFLPSPRRRG